jgi:tetratricopeptide (TPR) repeat protein
VAGVLIVVALVAHSGALNGGFHYDDSHALVENPAIRSWQPVFYLTSSKAFSGEGEGQQYRPLTVATFAFNYAIGRLEPWGYLLINLLLHIAVSWMVFVVGRLLLGDDRWAAFAALLFAVHPVNAEAVNYVVARSSLLAALGALVAFWAFVRRQHGGGVGWLVAGLFAFVAALLSKESATALIPPLLTSSLVVRGAVRPSGERALPRPFREALWFVGIAAGFAAVWLVVVGNRVSEPRGAAYPVWAFAEMVGRSILLWVWPWPLGLDHPLRFIDRFDPLLAVTLAAGGLGLVVAAIRWCTGVSLMVWSAIWVVAGFLPLVPLFWLTTRALFQENRMAFSAVGLAWLTAAAARAAWDRLDFRLRSVPVARGLILAVCAVLGIGAVGADRWRSEVWRDDRRLWQEVVRRSPDNLTAYVNLGLAHLDAGALDPAEATLREGLARAPNDERLYFDYNLALVALRRGRHDEARAAVLNVIALDSRYWKAYRVLAIIELKRGDRAAALSAVRRAIAINPRDARAYAHLGLLAQRAGDESLAETSYLETLRYDPFNAKARNNLGVLYLDRGRLSEALDQLTVALKEEPEYLEAAYNRAVALQRLGRVEEAGRSQRPGPDARIGWTAPSCRRCVLGDGVIGAGENPWAARGGVVLSGGRPDVSVVELAVCSSSVPPRCGEHGAQRVHKYARRVACRAVDRRRLR